MNPYRQNRVDETVAVVRTEAPGCTLTDGPVSVFYRTAVELSSKPKDYHKVETKP